LSKEIVWAVIQINYELKSQLNEDRPFVVLNYPGKRMKFVLALYPGNKASSAAILMETEADYPSG
jgi:hypothetical protein